MKINKKIAQNLIPIDRIESKILHLRGQKVILDYDLAVLYGVETKKLNQAVKRNLERFPDDFMFKLNKNDIFALAENYGRLKISKHSSNLPYAFTEQGVGMLSGILENKLAIEINIEIMRVFVNIRKREVLAMKIDKMEKKYDEKFAEIMNTINQLV